MDWYEWVGGSEPVLALGAAVERGDSAAAAGARGSAAALVAGSVAQQLGRTVLLVVAHLDEADDALDDLEGLADAVRGRSAGLRVERFGALEVLPGESGLNLDLVAERLGVVERLSAGRMPTGVVSEKCEERGEGRKGGGGVCDCGAGAGVDAGGAFGRGVGEFDVDAA